MSTSAVSTEKVVDVHTHIYPPAYINYLRSRSTVPYIRQFPEAPNPDQERLVILPSEEDAPSTSRGRPIGKEYWDIDEKLLFMKTHGIDMSIVSLPNPWLDWVPSDEAAATARGVNDDFIKMCQKAPDKIRAFATLPLSAPVPQIVEEIERIAKFEEMRGVIMGTSGIGQGLDDPALDPVWQALEANKKTVFLHPHYGLPNAVYGPRANDYGHVLPLALGFPLETTIAVTRMILSGVFDRYPSLSVLLAHSGGTLPFLAGRIESCIVHDGHMQSDSEIKKRRGIWDILKTNVYLDAVAYGEGALKAAVEASGADRIMFGTDHPFFPPLEADAVEWLSTRRNQELVPKVFENGDIAAVMGGNALKHL
jgi:aminocarboxymuconate-semialdehyde decarboxylase